MRWVFYSLLVLNLVYLGWSLTRVLAPTTPRVALNSTADASGGQRLQLLTESPQPRRAASAPAGGSLCPVIGPWASQADAEAGLTQLKAAGIGGVVRAVTVNKDRLNWVYLPPYQDRKRALRVLHDLQDRGVDSFIVKDGDDANAISLGYFSSKESAEGLRVKMRNAGYPAFVRETSKQVTEYWLYLLDKSAEKSPALSAFLEGNQGVAMDRMACDVAGGE
ncbi:MAG: SPOR domain-containing protein [Alcanivorax sp.]|nr:SPOR domain-containing protein [Alcanivorax sp.]